MRWSTTPQRLEPPRCCLRWRKSSGGAPTARAAPRCEAGHPAGENGGREVGLGQPFGLIDVFIPAALAQPRIRFPYPLAVSSRQAKLF